jgi:hypothetical protein
MRSLPRGRCAGALGALLVVLLGGCTSTTAPEGYLELPIRAAEEAYGGWATVDYALEDGERIPERERNARVHGELLAVTADSLFVLRPAGDPGARRENIVGDDPYRHRMSVRAPEDTVIVLPRDRVLRVQLTGYQTPASEPAVWTTLGTISTLSHGFLLVLSAPFWIVAGSAISASYSREGETKYPKKDWNSLRTFARFPQGWPSGLDRRVLRARH